MDQFSLYPSQHRTPYRHQIHRSTSNPNHLTLTLLQHPLDLPTPSPHPSPSATNSASYNSASPSNPCTVHQFSSEIVCESFYDADDLSDFECVNDILRFGRAW
ncbi:hypothetical protein JAAARDRAFT_502957 [Jaapia argillacea MUCL 33604]|uniref:Uncharacterized protein n=1 Tax=Jaapia argillacea MUCL 33604 TaxID=933084 RepID=A0A067PAA2_9AGAM|nr:hypothetical protein JAAARDRAFT_502957 [Jaapia argillacea MUCL 33604]